MLIKMKRSPSSMSNSSSLCALYAYMASTYLTFLAPRLGATAGPFFFCWEKEARLAVDSEREEAGRGEWLLFEETAGASSSR
jgi:hypothetical protein